MILTGTVESESESFRLQQEGYGTSAASRFTVRIGNASYWNGKTSSSG